MKVYEPKVLMREDGNGVFSRLTFVGDGDRQRFNHTGNFKGLPMIGEFALAYAVTKGSDSPGDAERPLADRLRIGYLNDPMALSRRALDVLLPHMDPAVQVVPLDFDESEYGLLNVVNVIDALDLEHSEVPRYEDGAFRRVQRYAFHPDIVRDQWIFKIKQTQSRAFVTDRFVDLVNQAGLTGFDFEAVWSAEPVMQDAGI